MKTAKKVPTSYELSCPECGATLPAPGGSLFWDVNEIHTGQPVTCPECKAQVRLPKA